MKRAVTNAPINMGSIPFFDRPRRESEWRPLLRESRPTLTSDPTPTPDLPDDLPLLVRVSVLDWMPDPAVSRTPTLEFGRYPDSSCRSRKLPSTRSGRGFTSTSRPLSLALRPSPISSLRALARVSSFLLVIVSPCSVDFVFERSSDIDEPLSMASNLASTKASAASLQAEPEFSFFGSSSRHGRHNRYALNSLLHSS